MAQKQGAVARRACVEVHHGWLGEPGSVLQGGDSFALKTHICHIRQKLNLIKGRPGYISSVPHIGYMLEMA